MDQQLVHALQEENQQLRQRLAHLEGLLHQRSMPVLGQVIDALANAANAAQMGDPMARQLVGEWRQALEKAQAASTSLVVVNGPIRQA